MSFINWGHETPEQKEIRRKLEEQALIQQAITRKIFEARGANSSASAASAAGSGIRTSYPLSNKLAAVIPWGILAPGGTGSDGDDSTSFNYWETESFPAVTDVTRLVLFTRAGANAHVHSDGLNMRIAIELYNNLTDSWVRVWSHTIHNPYYPDGTSDDYYFDVDANFSAISSVTKIRMTSNPGQDQSYHDWDGASFDLYQLGDEGSTAFQLVWSDVADAPVADPTDVSDWNNLFEDNYFDSVEVVGNIVNLTPIGSVTFKSNLFSPDKYGNQYLLEIIDNANCVTTVNSQALAQCHNLTKAILPACTYIGFAAFENSYNLTTVDFSSVTEIAELGLGDLSSLASLNLPELVTAGDYAFSWAYQLKSFSAPKLETVGNYCFTDCYSLETAYMPLCTALGGSTGNNSVFYNIDSMSFTLTVDSSLESCNGGNPDGDIAYVQTRFSPENITINYVTN